MQCVILAGGLGTRMLPITEKIPKALIPVKGHPFLKYQLDWLRQEGVAEVVLCVGYRGEMIEAFAQTGQRWGLKINYVKEGDRLRGTAGALRLALDQGILSDRFLVLYGDSFLPISFSPVWNAFISRREPALMTVLKNDEKWDNSNACFDGEKITLYAKGLKEKPAGMRFVDYGLCAFRRQLIADQVLPEVSSDLAQLLHVLSGRGELAGFEVDKRFFEVGSPAGLIDFEAYLEGALKV